MAEYIDREALLRMLPDDLPYKASVKRVLMQAPTADVVEVRHGEWQDAFDDIQKCSVCNHMCYYPRMYGYNFCPNCGAKMDSERKYQ